MNRKILLGLLFTVAGGLISGYILMAQDMSAPPGTYISKAQVTEGIANFKIPKMGLAGGKSVDILPELVFRVRYEGPNNASSHSTDTDGQNYTEVTEVIDGSGTFETGGSFVDKNPVYKDKDRLKGIEGGVSQEVKAGDFVIVPPATPHWFKKINGHVTIVETRFPGNVTRGKH